jgi:hypothetical protein
MAETNFAVDEKARAAALLLVAGEPELDLGDLHDIAETIERAIQLAREGHRALREVERAVPRGALVPTSQAEREGLVPLAEVGSSAI